MRSLTLIALGIVSVITTSVMAGNFVGHPTRVNLLPKVTESYFEYRQYENCPSYSILRDPYAPEYTEDWQFEIRNATKLDSRFLFWENTFHFRTAQGKVRHVGLEYYIGLHVLSFIDVFKYHHSQHVTEVDRSKFPLEDSYGVRLFLIRE